MSSDNGTSMREHAWRYFEVHASQRITLFNYFLIVSGAVAAGLATTLQGTQRFAALGILLGLILVLVSFVFWKLDQRSSFLVKHAESALSETEKEFPARAACLFSREDRATEEARQSANIWSRQWSYGTAFRVVFVFMAIFGVLGASLSALQFAGIISWAATVTPNPSLEATATGKALGPPPGVVHHPSSGPSALPASAPQLKR